MGLAKADLSHMVTHMQECDLGLVWLLLLGVRLAWYPGPCGSLSAGDCGGQNQGRQANLPQKCYVRSPWWDYGITTVRGHVIDTPGIRIKSSSKPSP